MSQRERPSRSNAKKSGNAPSNNTNTRIGDIKMKLELTSDEIGWVKYALMRASATRGRDKDMTLKEERLLLRIKRKIERQEKQRGEG